LNASLPAAVFMVLHIPSNSQSMLPMVIGRTSGLPVFHALNGAVIEQGKIYVAPPDHHLIVDVGRMRVVKDHARTAIALPLT